ncbi:MAG: c-type cytochrome [Ramlibacter sp.]
MVRLALWLIFAVTSLPLAFAQEAPAAQGRQIASSGKGAAVPACAGCHGQKGEGVAVFPRLAGAGQAYLVAQLEAFADGSRGNPIMKPIAQALSAAERVATAQYYSRLPAPFKAASASQPTTEETGAWLAIRGRWDDQLPACSQCHGAGGSGVGSTFPPLAGLPAAYIAEQLQAWKKGTRPAGPLGLMPAIAKKMTDAEVAAVGSYYEGIVRPPAAASAAAPAASAPARPGSAPPRGSSMPAGTQTGFRPSAESSLPTGEYGKMVQLGRNIMMDTRQYAGPYVGNDLKCATCHLDAGRKSDAAPMWGAFIHYPAFRAKTGKVDTLASRFQQCFEYSMNGKAPPTDGEVITALQTYASWLAKGAQVGLPLAGSGFPKLKQPPIAPDYARGEKIYAANCALCHGADGQGQKVGTKQAFPPLWGSRSYNWGAGMHQLGNASSFIRNNMPLGKGGTLSEQEAWDVAVFMNSHERPQDPRYTQSVARTRQLFHDTGDSLYGTTVNGKVLGSGR